MPVNLYNNAGVGLITMTDHKGGNRLNPALLESLKKAFEQHEHDENVRFILLQSNGSTFCLGMDIDSFLGSRQGNSGEEFAVSVRSYARLLAAIHQCSKTVVVLVQGAVKAGGIGLVAACDIVVASDMANFELSELYLGLIPANVMPYVLSMRMPAKRAAYLVQSAACVDANKAMMWGLVDEVHSAGDTEKALKQLGRRLMRISPVATARYKTFQRELQSLSAESQQDLAIKSLVDLASEDDVFNAIKQFSDGSLPSWFVNFRPTEPLCDSYEGVKK